MLKTACFKLWVLPIPRELRAARGGFFLPLHLVSPSVVAQRQLGSGLCPVILSKPPPPPLQFLNRFSVLLSPWESGGVWRAAALLGSALGQLTTS